jgi:hypothetical protein
MESSPNPWEGDTIRKRAIKKEKITGGRKPIENQLTDHHSPPNTKPTVR